jgi:hypothetical protein
MIYPPLSGICQSKKLEKSAKNRISPSFSLGLVSVWVKLLRQIGWDKILCMHTLRSTLLIFSLNYPLYIPGLRRRSTKRLESCEDAGFSPHMSHFLGYARSLDTYLPWSHSWATATLVENRRKDFHHLLWMILAAFQVLALTLRLY